MKAEYQIADRRDSRALAEFLSGEGQALLPMLELIEQAEMAVDELVDVAGRATIEAVLTLSAQELAGPKHPGKKARGVVGWHGRQDGVVSLAVSALRHPKQPLSCEKSYWRVTETRQPRLCIKPPSRQLNGSIDVFRDNVCMNQGDVHAEILR